MSKASDETHRVLGIINIHDVLTKYAAATGQPMPVAVIYRTQTPGRGYQCAAWQVHRPGFKTDPRGEYWRDYGNKTFNVLYPREDKAPQLEVALAWAGERYGVTEWVQVSKIASPGGYIPKSVADWFEAARKAALAAEKDGVTK